MSPALFSIFCVTLVFIQTPGCRSDPHHHHGPTSKCYGDLGCFTTEGHFKDYVLPMDPAEINTSFFAYTRGHQSKIKAGETAGIQSAHISHTRRTILLVHGYFNSATTKWLSEMKDKLLHQGDYNVIVVDWGKGSGGLYNQAAANAILVGAEIARLLRYLHDHFQVTYGNVHLIGHSLGAQACGFAGSKLHGVGRISGLDPAQPFFEEYDHTVKLDPSDAHFVDVIHTDAQQFIGITGFGVVKPCGHLDFYPNGGNNQPGCIERQSSGAITDIINGNFSCECWRGAGRFCRAVNTFSTTDAKSVGKDLSCSHSRAHYYYMHTISSSACPLYGHTCSDYKKFEGGECFSCSGGHNCPVMGFHAHPSHKGSYYLNTLSTEPYCGKQYFVEVELSEKMWDGYGQIFIQLIGFHGESSFLMFNRKAERFQHKHVEHHVVISDKDVGNLKEVKIKFIHKPGLGGLFAAKELKFHRVTVKDDEGGRAEQFCAHDHTVQDNHVIAAFSSRHC